jgi:hypothetical protein
VSLSEKLAVGGSHLLVGDILGCQFHAVGAVLVPGVVRRLGAVPANGVWGRGGWVGGDGVSSGTGRSHRIDPQRTSVTRELRVSRKIGVRHQRPSRAQPLTLSPNRPIRCI